MGIDPGDPSPIRAGGASRSVILGGLSAVIVVLAAGLVGASHLTGPRWSEHRSPPPSSTGGAGGGTSPAPAAPGLPASHGLFDIDGAWIIIGLGGVLLLALAALSWQWWRRRRRRRSPEPSRAPMRRVVVTDPLAPEEPEAEPLLDDIAAVLEALDTGGQPADAIVRAWLDLETAAERSGIARRRAETPTEFTARVLSRALGDERAITTLLGLYLRVRFGEDPPTAAEVSEVRVALGRLTASWRTGRRLDERAGALR